MKRALMLSLSLTLMRALCSAQTNQPVEGPTDKAVIAVVLGKEVTVQEKDKLNGLIFSGLLENFAKENKIEPTAAELDTFTLKLEEKIKQSQIKREQDREKLVTELQSSSLSDRERTQKESELQTIERILKSNREMKEESKEMEEQMRLHKRQIAQRFVRTWKINQALFAKYGGRVIFQQGGPEPLDAYRDFLREQERKGAFQILDKQYEPAFWRYFTNEAMHTFYSKEDGARNITTPWWLMETAPEAPAVQPAPRLAKPAAARINYLFFECRGNELFYVDKDGFDALFAKMLAGLTKGGAPQTNVVAGDANYTIDLKSSGIGLLRLHPRAGVHGETAADLTRATSQYHTLLQRFDPKKYTIFFLQRDDSAEVFHQARQLAEAAGFATTTAPLSKNEPTIMFSH